MPWSRPDICGVWKLFSLVMQCIHSRKIHASLVKITAFCHIIAWMFSIFQDTNWILGCKSDCRDGKVSIYSKVKGKLLACDVNIRCKPNTWYHMACVGFRKLPFNKETEVHTMFEYICPLCQPEHSNYKELIQTNGLLSITDK